jgi:transmembrane sensor
VLGTVFSVRKLDSRDPVHIAVQSGKVMSKGLHSEIIISAGVTARVTDTTARSAMADSAPYTDWVHGQLVFERSSVGDLLSTAERWYGYRFVLADSTIAAKKVSVVLKIADSADMIRQIKAVLDVAMTFRGDTITLSSVRAPQGRARKSAFKPFTEMGR